MQTITKTIGATERTLRALLDRELAPTPVRFDGWTLLVFLNQGEADPEGLVEKLLGNGIVDTAQAGLAAVARLVEIGWAAEAGGLYGLTPLGKDQFRALAGRVQATVSRVLEGIDEAALAQAEATLKALLDRAQRVLAG